MSEDFIDDDDWTDSTVGAQCPYCGHENYVESEDYAQTVRVDRKCAECEKTFEYEIDFTVSFQGYKK